jgi:hypothetical protein
MKSGAVPSDNGFRLDDKECLFPSRPASANEQPEDPVEGTDSWARMPPLEYRDLLAERQILEKESVVRAKEANQGPEAESKETKHSRRL